MTIPFADCRCINLVAVEDACRRKNKPVILYTAGDTKSQQQINLKKFSYYRVYAVFVDDSTLT